MGSLDSAVGMSTRLGAGQFTFHCRQMKETYSKQAAALGRI